jgi:chitinase
MLTCWLIGNWDKRNPIGSIVNPHTNLTEIDEALKLLWRIEVPPEKVVLGLAFYGRSFQLADGGCTKPTCPFAGPAAKGICTGEEGILSYMEIQNILQRTNAKPTYDKTAGVQYVVFNGNQWVSYDDAKTIKQKIEFARVNGLSGLMTWAIDLDDSKNSLLKAMAGLSFDGSQWANGNEVVLSDGGSSSIGSKCKVTDCHQSGVMSCPNGYLFQTYLDGSGSTSSTEMTCPDDKQRSLCCPADHNPDQSQCKWRACGEPCEFGESYIATDWVGENSNRACSPQTGVNYKSYCCRIDNSDQYFDYCKWSGCEEDPKCGVNDSMKDYTEELVRGYSLTEKTKNLCPSEFCQFEEECDQKSAKFCCKSKVRFA